MSTIWIAQYRPRGAYADPETGWRIFGDPVLMGWTHKGFAEQFMRDKNEPGAYYDRSQFEWRAKEYAPVQLGEGVWFVVRDVSGAPTRVAGGFDTKERAEKYRDTLFADCQVREYGPR